MTNLKKKLHKRWGKKFIDKRDWHLYNEQLVKQGEYLLAIDFVEGWNPELASMNAGKQGAPYQFPNSFIELQAVWHAKRLPYRMIEGMSRDLHKIGQLPDYNDYSTVNRRVNKLAFTLALPQGENIVVFSDGTGLQAVAGGEYLREKYGKKNRRWVQVIILGDAKTHEPVSYEVNIIQESEAESTEQQLATLLKNDVPIVAAGGDGAMDSMSLWNFCDEQDILPIIKPDKNARIDTDSKLRNTVVKERNRLGYKRWARKHEYGTRWPATEGIFSATKRMFGEQIAATSENGMIQEAACKIWAYQKLKRYGEA
ncbi:MAG: IS5 family transposase [Patescibacteria group bacterium]